MKNIRYSEYGSVDGGYTVYAVYGEDPNCDMGGSHSNPFLGTVEGTFNDVLEHAANHMKGFYTWGGGGYIKPTNTLKENYEPIVLDKTKKLKLERKEKLKKLTRANLNYLIENIDSMSKEDIKNNLIEIANNLTDK